MSPKPNDPLVGELPNEAELPVIIQGAWVANYFQILPARAQNEVTQFGTALGCFVFKDDGTFSAKVLRNFSGTARPLDVLSGAYSLVRNQQLGVIEGEIIVLAPSDPPGGPPVERVRLACYLKSRNELAWTLKTSSSSDVIMQGTMDRVAY